MQHEDLLRAADGFGRYQILLLVWGNLVTSIVGAELVFLIFAGLQPANTTNSTSKFYSAAIEWDLVGEKEYRIRVVMTLQMGGVLSGALLGGVLSDRFGRKRTLMLLLTVLPTLAVLQVTYCNQWATFAFLRYLCGTTISATILTSIVHTLESMPHRWRILGSLARFTPGMCMIATLVLITQHWRKLLMLIYLPLPFIWLGFFFVHESPKWLMQAKGPREAARVFEKIAQMNGATNVEEMRQEKQIQHATKKPVFC